MVERKRPGSAPAGRSSSPSPAQKPSAPSPLLRLRPQSPLRKIDELAAQASPRVAEELLDLVHFGTPRAGNGPHSQVSLITASLNRRPLSAHGSRPSSALSSSPARSSSPFSPTILSSPSSWSQSSPVTSPVLRRQRPSSASPLGPSLRSPLLHSPSAASELSSPSPPIDSSFSASSLTSPKIMQRPSSAFSSSPLPLPLSIASPSSSNSNSHASQDQYHIIPSSRTLNQQFQSSISEIESMINQCKSPNVRPNSNSTPSSTLLLRRMGSSINLEKSSSSLSLSSSAPLAPKPQPQPALSSPPPKPQASKSPSFSERKPYVPLEKRLMNNLTEIMNDPLEMAKLDQKCAQYDAILREQYSPEKRQQIIERNVQAALDYRPVARAAKYTETQAKLKERQEAVQQRKLAAYEEEMNRIMELHAVHEEKRDAAEKTRLERPLRERFQRWLCAIVIGSRFLKMTRSMLLGRSVREELAKKEKAVRIIQRFASRWILARNKAKRDHAWYVLKCVAPMARRYLTRRKRRMATDLIVKTMLEYKRWSQITKRISLLRTRVVQAQRLAQGFLGRRSTFLAILTLQFDKAEDAYFAELERKRRADVERLELVAMISSASMINLKDEKKSSKSSSSGGKKGKGSKSSGASNNSDAGASSSSSKFDLRAHVNDMLTNYKTLQHVKVDLLRSDLRRRWLRQKETLQEYAEELNKYNAAIRSQMMMSSARALLTGSEHDPKQEAVAACAARGIRAPKRPFLRCILPHADMRKIVEKGLEVTRDRLLAEVERIVSNHLNPDEHLYLLKEFIKQQDQLEAEAVASIHIRANIAFDMIRHIEHRKKEGHVYRPPHQHRSGYSSHSHSRSHSQSH